MKKVLFILILLSLLIMPACKAVENGDSSDGETGYVKSNLERETSPQVDSRLLANLAMDNSAFALSFFNEIRAGNENIIFSPLSLSLALSMTMAGAEDSTETSMMEALQFTLPEQDVHPAFNAVLLAIEASENKTSQESEGTNFQLNIANSIWGQAGYDFKEEFLNTLATNYGAGIYNVDYKNNPENARKAINGWVAEETEDKIQDLIPQGAIDSLTRLVLANAIYFNGSWRFPFNENATEKAPFSLLDGSQVTVDMMSLTGENLHYFQCENFQAVQLPYLSSDFVMTLFVPDSGAYQEFEEDLNLATINEILLAMSFVRVDLRMPKFDFESTIDTKAALKALGMSEAFDMEAADFSGISEPKELYITDVLHKATITVDEEGTESAAATAVIIGMKSAPSEEPISLVIDRPFLFFIQHIPTKTILFMGRVTQP